MGLSGYRLPSSYSTKSSYRVSSISSLLIFLLAYDLCLVWGRQDELWDCKLFCLDMGYSSSLFNLYRSFNTVARYCMLRSKISPTGHWWHTQSGFDLSVHWQGLWLRFGIVGRFDVDVPRLDHHLLLREVEALLLFRPLLPVHNKIIDICFWLTLLLISHGARWRNV